MSPPLPALVPLRCIKCSHRLLDVQREHEAMVKARISIKCYHCGTVQ